MAKKVPGRIHVLNGDLLSILSIEINCEMHEIHDRFRHGESLIPRVDDAGASRHPLAELSGNALMRHCKSIAG
jgi:hypothetical protein